MVHYGIELSTKHPSETNNNSKIYHVLVKNNTFYNIPIKIKISCYQNNIGIKYFADIRFGMFLVQIGGQK